VSYLSHTDAERRRMLQAIGVDRLEDLYEDVPQGLRLSGLDVPAGLSEVEVLRLMQSKAAENLDLETRPSFLGGGAYFGYVPAAVGAITGRAEFYTSYTPYQPEVSQGTLQVIYEFQSMICLLTGLDVANASLYDGATAVAEAASMALNATGRNRVLVPDTLSPEYRRVLSTYAEGIGYDVDVGPIVEGGQLDVTEEHAAVIVQNPDFLGSVVAMEKLATLAHSHGALFIAVVDPISLGILKPPGEYGADIAVGEGQNLGGWLSYGGPYLGFIASTPNLQRRLPGRIAGATVDDRGNPAYVLTLQTREQHIRRERATSNICTNEALVALGATVYMALLGKEGLREVAEHALQKAHYAADRMGAVPGFGVATPSPFFREFALRCPVPAEEVNRFLLSRDILGGLDLSRIYPDNASLRDCLLLGMTEMTTRNDIDACVSALTDMVAARSTTREPAGVGGRA